ncbi:MAG: hypothetical protein N2C14_06785 [Planctomycetales bacterium]
MTHRNIATLKTTTQDDMRAQASAGSGSFRREKSLKRRREEDADQVKNSARKGRRFRQRRQQRATPSRVQQIFGAGDYSS